jgi:hypothetical protein
VKRGAHFRLWGCLAAACAVLALPASAMAVKCAPPGNSQVDQYFATVPGSVCNFPSTGPGSGSHGSLPPGTRSQLSAQGPVGKAVEELVSRSGSNAKSGGKKGSATGAALLASGSGPVSGLLQPLSSGSSSGGVGVLLPIFLIGAVVLALGVVVLRRISGSSGPQT